MLLPIVMEKRKISPNPEDSHLEIHLVEFQASGEFATYIYDAKTKIYSKPRFWKDRITAMHDFNLRY